jgi:predicted dienelactone hydrolase
MRQVLGPWLVTLIAVVSLSCGAPPTAEPAQAMATIPQVAEQAAPAEAMPEPVPFPLSEPGPYYVGKRTYTFEDPSRDGRQVRVSIYYPALRPEGSTGTQLLAGTDRDPDLSSAPYPLILTGPDTGDQLFKTHLATHGFAMAIVRFPEYYDNWDLGIIDHPRDIVFALDQIASQPLEGLEGIIDTDRAGVAGYSWEGFYSLALSGVRIDPKYYLSYCEQAPTMEPELAAWYLAYICDLASNWDEFATHVGKGITANDEGLWQPVTDERIRAVMPMAPDGAWLYGERGLAMADRPALMIQATEDSPYQPIEAAFIFEHLGTPEKSMISFIGKTHMMVFQPEPARRMNHFVTAFFGTYLQGKVEYRDCFSEEFVSQFDDLAWGVYEGK